MSVTAIRQIVLGVTGGIAAYKSADLVRRLRERDLEVRVVMTAAACEFITPLTLQALSGNPVRTSLLDPAAEAAMGHIELARWADVVLVAPASADAMAKLANGLADDLLSTLCLATEAPVVLAPAMNRQMWGAAATRSNADTLRARGVALLGPGDGSQACGEVGPGRMLEPADIVERLIALAGEGRLTGVSVLVTAGPTREAIDPVRFLSNHSSGKMGYAVAAAAAEAGARVTLVSGPTVLETPRGVERVQVTSAGEMYSEVMARAAGCDIFIGAAAVADYRPIDYAGQKIKKQKGVMALALEPTNDIIAEVAALSNGPFTVGFAAETDDVEGYARDKLRRKSLDLIAANRVGVAGAGFDADTNALTVLWPDGEQAIALAPKRAVAGELIEIVTERYFDKHPA